MGQNLKLHPKYKQWIIRITVRYVGKHALCKQRARGSYTCYYHQARPHNCVQNNCLLTAMLAEIRRKCFKHLHKIVCYLYIGILLGFSNIFKNWLRVLG